MNWRRYAAPLFHLRNWVRYHVELRDRVKPFEVRRTYGQNVDVARRRGMDYWNLDAKDVNSSIAIAGRAITDAVGSLKWKIVNIEKMGGVERETEDQDHPANELLQDPNSDMTFRDVVKHATLCYLQDGNAIQTIERQTGPNARIELWPRNPRPPYVEPILANGVLTGYRFGSDGSFEALTYAKNRVVHIRDVNPEDPIWGKPRWESVRLEVEMDYYIKTLNRNFFKNGAIMHLMFTPDKNMNKLQHDELMALFDADQTGVANFFRPFINRFAGKWEAPEQKHKDIAFKELLQWNRECVFGVFGLPPFRGGVMEYANYANALAQDKDFWNNSVRPITCTLEDAYNKQLIWRYWGRDVALRCDYSDVPALRGEPKEQAETDKILIDCGVKTPDEVRAERNLEPIADDERPKSPATPGADDPNDDGEGDPADKGPQPTKDEEEELAMAMRSAFSLLKNDVRQKITTYTTSGQMMSRLIYADMQTPDLFNRAEAYQQLADLVLPRVKAIGRKRCNATHKQLVAHSHYVPDDNELDRVTGMASTLLHDLSQELYELLRGCVADAITFNLRLPALLSRTYAVFGAERARQTAHALAMVTVNKAEALAIARRIGSHPRGDLA